MIKDKKLIGKRKVELKIKLIVKEHYCSKNIIALSILKQFVLLPK